MNMWTCEHCGFSADLAPEHFPLTCACGAKYQSRSARGLGDIVAKVTKAVGLRTCGGCERRRKALNKMFNFGDGDKSG